MSKSNRRAQGQPAGAYPRQAHTGYTQPGFTAEQPANMYGGHQQAAMYGSQQQAAMYGTQQQAPRYGSQQQAPAVSIDSTIEKLHSLCQEENFVKLVNLLHKSLASTEHYHSTGHASNQQSQSRSSGPSPSHWETFKSMLPGSKCSDCEALKQQLDEKDAEIKSLVSQLNAEMRKMQGNLGQNSSDQCVHDFRVFFSNMVDIMVQKHGVQDSESKRAYTELLCTSFQSIFTHVQELLVGQIQQYIVSALFFPAHFQGNAAASSEYKDLIRAYGRLLSSCGLVGQCPIQHEMLKDVKLPKEVQDIEFLNRCASLSWQLLTTVPPMLPHCPTTEPFNKDLHDEIGGRRGGVTKGQKLLYSKPILTNCTGKVYARGSVRSADKATGGVGH